MHVSIRPENYNTRPRSGITFLGSFTRQQSTTTSASWKANASTNCKKRPSGLTMHAAGYRKHYHTITDVNMQLDHWVTQREQHSTLNSANQNPSGLQTNQSYSSNTCSLHVPVSHTGFGFNSDWSKKWIWRDFWANYYALQNLNRSSHKVIFHFRLTELINLCKVSTFILV